MNAEESLSLARRFIDLPLGKRQLFLEGLRQEGVDFSVFPIPGAIDPRNRTILSYSQQRMWFLWRLDPQSGAYNLPCAVRLAGPLDRTALEKAFAEIVLRHETLRTVFQQQSDNSVQQVALAQPLIVGWQDLSLYSEEERERRAQDAAEQYALQPFDLAVGPLLRVKLLKLADQQHVLLVTLHHIVADGWSMNVLIDEFNRLYDACHRGEACPLTRLPIQYGDYAVWQRRWLEAGEAARQLDYWRTALGDEHPVFELPVDRPRPAVPSFRGRRHELTIDQPLAEQLRALAAAHNVTLFMLLLTSFQVLLFRYSGQRDIRVGVPIANRHREETESLIGIFVNTQVLRAQIDAHAPFADLLQQVKQATLNAQTYQDLPFEQLVDALRPERSLRHSPLFQAMYNHQPHAVDIETLRTESGLTLSLQLWESRTTQFDLSLDTFEKGDRLQAAFTYATDLFDASTIDRMTRHWLNLLRGIAADPAQSVADLPLLDTGERQRLLCDWNDTAAIFPLASSVHALIEAQVERTPNAVALLCGDEQLQYRELNTRANRLAHTLRARGVGPDVRVGIACERSIDMVVGLLAILKAGGAYVPFDPGYPGARLAYMLADSGIALLLMQHALQPALPTPAELPVLLLDCADSYSADRSNPVVAIHPEHLAYVIYTSGSTGLPKGAGNRHAALTNRLCWMQQAYALDASDTVLQKTPFSFDVSVWEFFWPLLSGARLAIAAPDEHRDPARLIATIQRHRVTTLHFVPSMLQAFLLDAEAASCDSLKRIICSGEVLPVDMQRQVFAQLPAIALYNLYGPTEAAVDVTHWTCRDEGRASVPIGRPIANLQLFILDSGFNPVAIGVADELYLGGIGLARGYHDRPGLTAERFVPNSFGLGGERLYRTGDLARYRADGALEYAGRIDHQVKLRGFRIELGEIEARLHEQASVREAAVIAQTTASGSQLVAYVVPAQADIPDASHEHRREFSALLKQALATQLPDYMVPAQWVLLAHMPLSPNGKLDRKALPAPGAIAAQREYVAPRNDIEHLLAAIWQDVLGVARIGVTDNFFALGGHSLLVIKVVEQLRRHGWDSEARALFRHAQLAMFAQTLAPLASRAVVVPPNRIPPACRALAPDMLTLVQLDAEQIRRIEAVIPGGGANIQDIYPLAPLQEGILFHHLLQTEGDAYVTPCLLSFNSRDDLDGFVAGLNRAIERHDILRTAIVWEGLPEPVQVVQREAILALEWIDAAGENVAVCLERFADPGSFRIDVRRAPLLRAIAAEDMANDRWLLQLPSHHLVMDHTTLERLVTEIGLIRQGREHELPPSIPFRDFVAQTRLRANPAGHETFFRALLGDIDEPTMPFRLLDVRGDGQRMNEARLALPADLAARIRRQARERGVSAAALFHLAWAIVLGKTAGRDDVVFGTVLSGRMQGGEAALGMFINTLPLRICLGDMAVDQCLQQTHAVLTDLLHHEHASLVLAQRCSSVAAGTPLFSSLLNYRHFGHADAPAAWRGITVLSNRERTNYPFNLSVDDFGNAFELIAQVDASIDANRVCAYQLHALEQIIDALESRQPVRVSELDIVPAAERRQLRIWSINDSRYAQSEPVHRSFERRVRERPQATALIFGDEHLSYDALNRRANRLAHRLIRSGVGIETRVGIAIERSVEMVVSVLAVLKAGGAYVPLDLEYPAARLQYMVEDSDIEWLLTRQRTQAGLGALAAQRTTLAVDALDPQSEADHDPVLPLHPDNLAYVIYTSGSTGRPKGAANRHGALANCMTWMQGTYGIDGDDTVLHKAAFGFDVSAWELFWPLTAGARLVIAAPDDHLDPQKLHAVIRRHRVTVVNFVPSMLQAFLDCHGLDCQHTEDSTLRYLICGGEAMPPATQRQGHACLPRASLQNLYGPTEAAIHVTQWTCRDDAQPVPIGRPIAGTCAHVLDTALRETATGVAGELYLGGCSLARGYLHRAALTAERFVPDPLADNGERLYRTGDLAQWNADGQLDYLGRIDHQVKIRGLRIELGEIEARLREQPQVRDAVALAHDGATGKFLVGYVIAGDEGLALADTLRAALKTALPDYMVPTQVLVLSAWPLTPNGKLDRNALPLPETSAQQRTYVAPQGELEQCIAAIWAEVLRVERVGRDDDFFELGGHSLLAMQAVLRLRERLQCDVPIKTLFTHVGLATFADAVARLRSADAGVDAVLSQSLATLKSLSLDEIKRLIS